MATDPLAEMLLGFVPPNLRDVSGHLLYSGRDAWSEPSPLYLMGVNPGGDPADIVETVTQSTERILYCEPANWSAYRDEGWGHPPGTHRMQRNVLHLFDVLGLDAGRVPASNLVFARSREEADIDRAQLLAWAETCWPFHGDVIERLQTRVVVCFGGTASGFVRDKLGAHDEVDRYSEANNRGWTSSTYRGRGGISVVKVTHPSRAVWTNPAADVSALVARALSSANMTDLPTDTTPSSP